MPVCFPSGASCFTVVISRFIVRIRAGRQDSTKLKNAVVMRGFDMEDGAGMPASPKGDTSSAASSAAASTGTGASSSAATASEPELVVVAESFEKLLEDKQLKKLREKQNKKLEELRKDFEKEKTKLEEELGIITKSKVAKTSSRLIKRISSKSLT